MVTHKPWIEKIVFLYLTAFTGTGGIEKFNRAFMKALYEAAGAQATVLSCYDNKSDNKYFPQKNFKGFGAGRIWFFLYACVIAFRNETIILGHINLAPIGILLKWIFPGKKLILIVHGIEVWNIHSPVKKYFLVKADLILSVSKYTRHQILNKYSEIQSDKIHIFYNTLDPYFIVPENFYKPAYLQQRYKVTSRSKIILTVARLSHTELYKGYDKIIEVLPEILKIIPEAVYLLAGKYTVNEKNRIEALSKQLGIEEKVILPGFIANNELSDHYLLADVFVMPSKKEGFGIVFIEALACGAKVIAGNKDGSAEALLYGELGTLVDPDNTSDIGRAIITQLSIDKQPAHSFQQAAVQQFGFKAYKQRLQELLTSTLKPI